jgi:excisionase family DNA binding protein
MSAAEKLLVTMTVDQLRELIRTEVRDAVAANPQQAQPPLSSLTAKEAAAYLKIPDTMVRKRARNGELKCFYIGTEMRFDVCDLQAFKEAHRAPPKKKAG